MKDTKGNIINKTINYDYSFGPCEDENLLFKYSSPLDTQSDSSFEDLVQGTFNRNQQDNKMYFSNFKIFYDKTILST